MKVAVDTRMLSDCHCEKWWGFFHSFKGTHVQTQCDVGHEAGSLQFATVRNVKLLVVVMD